MYVQQVFLGSKAEKLGLRRGDMIVSTSATAGDNMWSHDSVESVRSALSTRSAYTHTYIHTYISAKIEYIHNSIFINTHLTRSMMRQC
jgi:hypothetical protein